MERGWKVPVLVLLAMSSCQGDRLNASGGEFALRPGSLDFGTVWVGTPGSASVEATNLSRGTRTATIRVEGPFVLEGESQRVWGGGESQSLQVVANPLTDGTAEGSLSVESDGVRTQIPLHVVGKTPLACVPHGPCLTATFDPASGSCLEALLPEGASCEGGCLESAQCRAGACIGVQRDCDDQNACTLDACDQGQGCLHVAAHTCSSDDNPCLAPVCDPLSGCATVPVQDGSPCGPSDCTNARVCLNSQCLTRSVPEGSACGLGSPCQAPGVCHDHQCDRPPAFALQPRWRISAKRNTLQFFGVFDDADSVFWVECQALFVDHAGNDPAPKCDLVSATRDGLIRWSTPLDGPPTQQILTDGVVITQLWDHTLAAVDASTGHPLWTQQLAFKHKNNVPGQSRISGPLGVDAQQRVLVPVAKGQGSPSQLWGDGEVLRVDARTGQVLTSTALGMAASHLVLDEFRNFYLGGLQAPSTGGPPAQEWNRSQDSSGQARWQRPEAFLPSASANGILVDDCLETRDTSDGKVLHRCDLNTTSFTGLDRPTPLLAGSSGWLVFDPEVDAMVPRLVLGKFDLSTHARKWVSELTPMTYGTTTHPALEHNQSVLIGVAHPQGWKLQEISDDGSSTFACDLSPSDGIYSGAALMTDRWVVANTGGSSSPSLIAFDVPGKKLLPYGWSTWRGNPARTGSPR